MTHQYPMRAQELLQYMTLIRPAAQTDRGMGWCIYDHKFRAKAALNPTLDWSTIDQQLWLMIFTTSPDMLAQQYPVFSYGPHNQPSSEGSGREDFWNIYNGNAHCHREACPYRHMCNKCKGPNPRCLCLSIGTTTSGRSEDQNQKRDSRSSRSKQD